MISKTWEKTRHFQNCSLLIQKYNLTKTITHILIIYATRLLLFQVVVYVKKIWLYKLCRWYTCLHLKYHKGYTLKLWCVRDILSLKNKYFLQYMYVFLFNQMKWQVVWTASSKLFFLRYSLVKALVACINGSIVCDWHVLRWYKLNISC